LHKDTKDNGLEVQQIPFKKPTEKNKDYKNYENMVVAKLFQEDKHFERNHFVNG
jgi:hypothetical protein